MPTQRGFDEFFGVPYSHDMSPLPLLSNATVLEEPPDLNRLTERFTSEAVSFINRSKNTPFFLYMSHTAPHIPFPPASPFRGKSGFGVYGDAVQEIDWSVGEVLRAIRANGLDEKTLVIFSSDNGPWFQGSAGQLHGRKGETWEGGMRVPFIARFPGWIPANREVTDFATSLDIVPTVAQLCGAPPPYYPLDGVDIWPLLTGQRGDPVRRDAFLYFDSWHLQCARLGPWKLHVARYNAPPWVSLPAGWRQNVALSQPELYNLETDPGESYDAADRYPEIVAAIQARINALLPTFPDGVNSSWKSVISRRSYCPSGGWPSK
jgi:arylsulfatase